MSVPLTLLVLLVASALAVFTFRKLEVRKLTKGRVPQELDALRREVESDEELSALSDVVKVIASSYGIDPKLLRPNDSLQSLENIESWSFGGADILSEWLVREGISELPSNVVTVADLAREVQLIREKRNGPGGAP